MGPQSLGKILYNQVYNRSGFWFHMMYLIINFVKGCRKVVKLSKC